MADSNPNKIIESLTKQPIRITNPTDSSASAPKVENTLIHNPLTQGKTKDSPEYKNYVKEVFAKIDDYKKSPEYKKAALDAIFGKDDVDYNKFHNDLRSGFLKKYGYDEDLGRIAPGHLGVFDMEWSPVDGQNDRTLVGKRNSLTNLLSNGLSIEDIRDYFTQQQAPSNPYQKGYQFRSNGFIRKPTPDDLINARTFDESGEPYNIGAVENLTPQQMREFLQHPLNDYEWVTRNLPNLTADEKNGWGTILIDDGVSPYGYIVDPQGSNYPRYVLPVKLR